MAVPCARREAPGLGQSGQGWPAGFLGDGTLIPVLKQDLRVKVQVLRLTQATGASGRWLSLLLGHQSRRLGREHDC